MYYRFFIRPVLFLFSPERVHSFVVFTLKLAFKLPLVKILLIKAFSVEDNALERTAFGIRFKNPIGLAAGFDKNAELYNEFSSFGFSFIEIGTVTPFEQPGNPKPRSFRLPKDMALINRMGINNDGAEIIAGRLRKNKPNVIIGGNIGKNTLTSNDNAVNDYVYCFELLHDVVDYFVVNVSCPNIGDIKKLQDADTLMEILGRLKKLSAEKTVKKPILLKISPDLNNFQLDELVDIAFKTGIDGFVATNTSIKRDGLNTPKRKVDDIGNGGISGLPLKDRSTEVIRYLVNKSEGKIPVIGVGGIMDPDSAIEKLNAGACLVQLYTGFIYEGPSIIKRINEAVLQNSLKK